MIAAGAICWSTAGVVVRHVEADGWHVTFWRSAFMTVAMIPLLTFQWRQVAGDARRAGGAMLVSGVLLAATFVFFILALDHTTVANTLVVMATAPFLTALIGRIFLHERVTPATWAAIAVATVGICMSVVDALADRGWLGSLLAFLTALCFSINTNVVRHNRAYGMVPAVMLAGLFSALAALPMANPLDTSPGDLPWLAFLGIVQLGVGLVLFVIGARHVPGAQAGLVALLEIVLGPIWVWFGYGERPGTLGLVGGAVVLAAVIGNTLLGTAFRPDAGTVPSPEAGNR